MGLSVVDQLLIEISSRFRTHLRRDDTVSRSDDDPAEPGGEEILARMDGQQFTVLVEGESKRPATPCGWPLRLQESFEHAAHRERSRCVYFRQYWDRPRVRATL